MNTNRSGELIDKFLYLGLSGSGKAFVGAYFVKTAVGQYFLRAEVVESNPATEGAGRLQQQEAT